MALTQTERDILTSNLKTLKAQLEDIQSNTNKTFKSVILFAIIGIFFFPCLIIAIICYLLYKWGKSQSKEIENQIAIIVDQLYPPTDA